MMIKGKYLNEVSKIPKEIIDVTSVIVVTKITKITKYKYVINQISNIIYQIVVN